MIVMLLLLLAKALLCVHDLAGSTAKLLILMLIVVRLLVVLTPLVVRRGGHEIHKVLVIDNMVICKLRQEHRTDVFEDVNGPCQPSATIDDSVRLLWAYEFLLRGARHLLSRCTVVGCHEHLL